MKKQTVDKITLLNEKIETLATKTSDLAKRFQSKAKSTGKDTAKADAVLATELSLEMEAMLKTLKTVLPCRDKYKEGKCFVEMERVMEGLEKALPKCRLFPSVLREEVRLSVQELRVAIDKYSSV